MGICGTARLMVKAVPFALCSLLALSFGCAGAPPPPPDSDPVADKAPSDNQTPSADDKPAASDKSAEAKADAPADAAPKSAEPVEVPKPPAISCEPPANAPAATKKLEMSIDRAQVQLDDHRLQVKLNHPTCKVELKVFGESGRVIAESAQGFNGAAANTALSVSWVPARIEPILRIEVWVYDTSGRYVGMQLTPWNVSIDHEEVNFESDSDAIRDSETPKLQSSLDKIKEIAERHKDLKSIALYIGGHTDTVGSPEHNFTLSRKRAKAIAAWFRSKGLKMPIAFEGFGEYTPIVKSGDEKAEARNRRVDYILSLEPPRLPSGSVTFSWKGL